MKNGFSTRWRRGASLVCSMILGTGTATAGQVVHDRMHTVVAAMQPSGRLDRTKVLRIAASLPLRNQAALAKFLREVADPRSALYRKYLTPAEFTKLYGPSEADYAAVEAFGKQHGLKVVGTHANRLIVDLEGDTPAVENALHVKMQTYADSTRRRTFYAPDAEPTLDLATPVAEISGLSDYALPQPRLKVNRTRPAVATATATPGEAANAGSAPNGGYMGDDFRTAYVPGTALMGSGQTVGLLQFDGYTASDIVYYANLTGRTSIPLTNVLLDGFSGAPTGTGGEVEVSLDIEMVLSMAPGVSNIIVYEAGPNGNWHDILNRMATDNLAKQLSCSWYSPGGVADPTSEAIFQEMAAQGQSFFSASGDYDAFTGLIPFPGDSPNITQVGGTTLTTNGEGGSYNSETVWNWNNGIGSGGGISTQYPIPVWQQGIAMTLNLGSTTMRNVPDVAMTADNVYVRADGEDQNVGGTSCAAPLWAAFTALVNQQAAAAGRPPLGFTSPAVSALGLGTGYAGAFHDTVSGNNFSSGSPARFPATTGYDLCTGWGTPNGMGLINALAGPPDSLGVSYLYYNAVGTPGGPFSPTSVTYTLANLGTAPLAWRAAASQGWLSLSSTAGTLALGGSTTVTMAINSTADGFAAGTYTGAVTFTDMGTGVGQNRPATLVIAPPNPVLGVTPASGLAASGKVGGPFNPANMTYSVRNLGNAPMNWVVSTTSSWLNASPNSGTLAAGGTASVLVTIGNSAAQLAAGTYGDSIIFTNASNGNGNTALAATLNVTPPPPVITSGTFATGVQGNPISYQITATNNPSSYAAAGLPGGLTVSASGLISGAPAAAGTSSFTVAASNAGGTGSATVTLVVQPAPPVITSAGAAYGYVNSQFYFAVTASNAPTRFAAMQLPAGLSINSATGVISGTVTSVGTTLASVTASNPAGTGTAALQIIISQSDFGQLSNWPTFGNGPAHTGYQPVYLGTGTYSPGWTMTYPTSTSGLNQVAVSEGMVFVTPYTYFGDTYLSALNAGTGTELWRHEFVSSFSINPPTVEAGRVYTQKGNSTSPGNDSALWCFAVTSGSTLWTAGFSAQWERYYAPTVYETGVWVDGGEYGGLYGFNTADGSQRFFNSSLAQFDEWTPAYYNGTIYSWVDGTFRAHDPQTGAVLWSATTGWTWSGYSMNTAPAVDAGVAYIIGNPNLYGVNLSTHAIAWTVAGIFTGSPATAGGTVYAISSGSVYAYTGTTGAVTGTYGTGDTISGQPIVTLDTVIASSASATYLFNRNTFALEQKLPNGGPASLANGILYLAGGDGVLRTYVPSVVLGITLTLPSPVLKNAAVVTGTIAQNPPSGSSTVVSLTSSDPARATVPATVTLAAGQTRVTFPITIVDDGQLDGTQTVTITSSEFGYTNSTANLVINDDRKAVLTLLAPATATKGDGLAQGTVLMSAAAVSDVTVQLLSSNTSAATVPASVVIPAGQTTATFPIVIVNNGLVDGGQVTTITAHEAGWTDGTATLSVHDNLQLAITVPGTVSEGDGTVNGTVQAAGLLGTAATVSLASSISNRVSVPASVVIPAGKASAVFPITLIDNGIASPPHTAVISASANGYLDASGTMTVLDDHPAYFSIATIASPQSAGVPFGVTITARSISNDIVTGYRGPVALSFNDALACGPAISGTFANGVWNGAVTAYGAGSGIVLTASAANGAIGQSNAFMVNVSDYGSTANWPTFGNAPAHTGYQPLYLGTGTYSPGWTMTYPTSTSGLNQVAVSEGMVFVTPYTYFGDTYLSALNAGTGTELWRHEFVSSFSINPPTVEAGCVYTQKGNSTSPGNDSALWCFAVTNGSTLWTAGFGAQWERYYAPTVYETGVWVDGGEYSGLYGFNTADGSQRFFNSSLAQFDEWTPAYYNGTIYSWVDGTFRAHDPQTGAVLWSASAAWTWNGYSMNTVPAIDGGYAFFLSNPNLYAMNLAAQGVAWSVAGSFTGSPAAANGVVYAVLSGSVNAYNQQSGVLLGTYNTGDTGIGGQPIVTMDTLIVTSASNTYLFDLASHALKQTLPKGGAASLANGVVYLAGGDGVLRTYSSQSTRSLTVAAPSMVTSPVGLITGTVSVNIAPASNLAVSVVLNDGTNTGASAIVTVPAGHTAAAFSVANPNHAQTAGWTSMTLTANSPGYLTGTATLQVETPYEAWLTASFTAAQLGNPAISGAMAAPAGDGIPNLLKYALGLNPFANGTDGLPAAGVMSASGSNYLTLTYNAVIGAADIQYLPQVSGDLLNWYSGNGYVVPVNTSPNADGVTETVEVRDTVPMSPGTPRFIRLEVINP